jgi:hypothetical protein
VAVIRLCVLFKDRLSCVELSENLNVQWLYHGSQAPLKELCDEGLDIRFSRKGRFGRGIYFRQVHCVVFVLESFVYFLFCNYYVKVYFLSTKGLFSGDVICIYCTL